MRRNKNDNSGNRDNKAENVKTEKKFERPERDVRQIEGKNPILEALRSGVTIEKIMVAKGRRETGNAEIFELAKEKKIKIQMVDRKKLDYSSKTGNHQGIIAIATNFSYYEPEDMIAKAQKLGEDPFIVVLDQITDPHNFGAIIRTADACGVHGIIITKNRSVDLTPIAVKASAGAAENMMIGKVTNLTQTLKDLKKQGLWVGGAEPGGEAYYKTNFKGPLAVVIGSEGKGISRLVKEECDFSVSIPMYGSIESLNASVAAGIIFSEAARQRRDGN
ncbi:23S rRNA (guanosine(2251)-2'-O)-methyltransferase RlmB [Alkalibacter mobilis]|uniref:23S rRNA (guanosine(2251)-2'-O)-methyltransferase RlmB n=1 Tax=Alkalibacter mobilis TaxID=2787712 RepID=UPI00189C817A|nr:23S rRNA (guanosine(2251)-2'-O)-methyltransferase RlmB [Alkalibacter mobilis]MBF7096011.1 23S rRNA (guanosine(2251)-2'-O)-methyltransferase RlmB [Alkalibacter mobilis]